MKRLVAAKTIDEMTENARIRLAETTEDSKVLERFQMTMKKLCVDLSQKIQTLHRKL